MNKVFFFSFMIITSPVIAMQRSGAAFGVAAQHAMQRAAAPSARAVRAAAAIQARSMASSQSGPTPDNHRCDETDDKKYRLLTELRRADLERSKVTRERNIAATLAVLASLPSAYAVANASNNGLFEFLCNAPLEVQLTPVSLLIAAVNLPVALAYHVDAQDRKKFCQSLGNELDKLT